MNIRGSAIWVVVATAVATMGFVTRTEELVFVAIIPAVAALTSYIGDLKARAGAPELPAVTERRLAEMEKRLELVEGELDQANFQLDRLRAERDFDRQLRSGVDLAGPSRSNPGSGY